MKNCISKDEIIVSWYTAFSKELVIFKHSDSRTTIYILGRYAKGHDSESVLQKNIYDI